ncbi:hypothetical protein NA57DRAFT_73725 [Rhizodiscina lignyota]|uniref:Uncharacterized protein n=1 Tax=Rhizodiscina lignyota TaxID=1504668 RepID=A0A9P4M930_9PEZI|nr:hypothetical protein NA57DRAFT_73725 [Rhizodiscina lignyota]
MDLPLELRQEIFGHVLRFRTHSEGQTWLYPKRKASGHDGAKQIHKRLFTPLLYVKKQIRWEMIHVLKRRVEEVKQIQADSEGLWFPAPIVSDEAQTLNRLIALLVRPHPAIPENPLEKLTAIRSHSYFGSLNYKSGSEAFWESYWLPHSVTYTLEYIAQSGNPDMCHFIGLPIERTFIHSEVSQMDHLSGTLRGLTTTRASHVSDEKASLLATSTIMDPATLQPSTFSFMDLPIELRQKILKFLLDPGFLLPGGEFSLKPALGETTTKLFRKMYAHQISTLLFLNRQTRRDMVYVLRQGRREFAQRKDEKHYRKCYNASRGCFWPFPCTVEAVMGKFLWALCKKKRGVEWPERKKDWPEACKRVFTLKWWKRHSRLW